MQKNREYSAARKEFIFERKDFMKFKVVGKSLILTDYSHKITEGENSFDTVEIAIPRYHDECDLSTLSFRFSEISENGETAAVQVLRHEKCDEKYIYLKGAITSDFSAITGKVIFMLTGINGENVVAKFQSDPFTVSDDISLASLPNETTAEQLFNQTQLEIQKAIDAAERAEKASQTPAPAEIYPATSTRLGGVLSGNDISVSDIGVVTVNSVNGKTLGKSVPENAVFTDTIYNDMEIKKNLLNKVDKVNGKSLSSNDLTDDLKRNYDSAAASKHSHENKAVLDEISLDKIAIWDGNSKGTKTIIKTSPYIITNTVNYPIIELHLYGKSIQNGVPSLENPIEITSIGDNGKIKISSDNGADISNFAQFTTALPLCGIPVSSNGNYTDQNNQQWVCDELIYYADGTGKVIKRIESIMLNGSNEISWENLSVNSYGINNFLCRNYLSTDVSTIMCNRLSRQYTLMAETNTEGIYSNENGIFIRLKNISTISGLKTWLNNNNLNAIYAINHPHEVTLTSEELSALTSLQTHSQNTYVKSEPNADISVKYCCNHIFSELIYPIIKKRCN